MLRPSHRHLEFHHREMQSRVPQEFFSLSSLCKFHQARVQLGPSRAELDPGQKRTCMSIHSLHGNGMGNAEEYSAPASA